MNITAVETVYLPRGITVHVGAVQYLWIRIHTDEGLIWLGETYPNAEAKFLSDCLVPETFGCPQYNVRTLHDARTQRTSSR